MATLTEIENALSRTPAVLASLLDGVDEARLDQREGPSTWNARQILGHLIHGEIDDWIPRARIILNEGTSRTFTPFDREGGFDQYARMPIQELLDEFSRRRSQNIRELRGFDLQPADLSRRGSHPDLGEVTLEQLLNCWVTHDLAHVYQITRLLYRSYGAGIGPWRAYFSLLKD